MTADRTPDLAALEALAEAATPGPWVAHANDFECVVVMADDDHWPQRYSQIASGMEQGESDGEADAAYIAAADPATVLWLIREVGRLRVLERCPHGQTATELCNAYPSLGDVHETQARAEKAEAAIARARALVADWQANGNSRDLGDRAADVWHHTAHKLLTVLDGGESE